jgi:sugar/nucleoside kinase (ribokinase family)
VFRLIQNKYLPSLTVFYEPTDMSLAGKPFELDRSCYEQIKFISPNLYELRKIADTLKVSPEMMSTIKIEDATTMHDEHKLFHEIIELCERLHTDNIIVTVGRLGVFVHRKAHDLETFFTKDLSYSTEKTGKNNRNRYYPGKSIEKIVNASGAGDAFVAGFISAMLKHRPEEICVAVGFEAAKSALMSKRAVPKAFFPQNHECWMRPADFKTPKDF